MKGSNMPQMRAAFSGWARRITLTKRTQCVVDGLVQSIDSPFTFRGTIQPLSPKQIMLKPEGERAWQWLQIHCVITNLLPLQPADLITYNNVIYKVMGQIDYSLNGYVEYHAVQDFQGCK